LLWLFFLFKLVFFIFLNFIIYLNFLENKNLFSCGENNFNKKGIFNNGKDLLIPTKIDFFKNIEIENLFTGRSSTFIKTIS
jgi:hypothetical protein